MSILETVISNTQENIINNQVLNSELVNSKPQFESKVTRAYNNVDMPILDVEVEPLHSKKYGVINDKKGIFCDSQCINVVSNSYEIHQPREIAEQFKNVSESHNLDVKKCLFNKSNGGLLISAKYTDTKIAGENHDVSVTFYTSHCGRYKTVLSLSALRIACFNQVPMIVKGKNNHLFAEKHYKNTLDVDNFGNLLSNIPELVEQHNARAEALRTSHLKFSDFVELCANQWKQDTSSKRWDKKVSKVEEAYYSGKGQKILENNTAYKAYNTITFLNTHDLRDTVYKEENILTKSAKESIEFEQVLLETCA